MLYICIPAYNEAPTIGVLLWRIRSVFQEYAREYELVVYDDGSTDATAEVLEPYTRVLPLTILSGGERRGYAAAVDALCRHVAAHTRYPRRDAMIVLQGDFTDRPEHIPELVKRFEGGADIVVAEREAQASDPVPVRRLRKTAPWLLRPFVRIDGVSDVTSGYRLVRISLLRDLLRERGDRPLVSSDGWGANAELLLALAPFARRIETMPVEARFDVRPRTTRIRPFADALALARFAWRARGSRGIAPGARASGPTRDDPRPLVAAVTAAPAVPELTLAEPAPSAGPERERTRSKRRADRPDRADRAERAERTERPDRPERSERPKRPDRPERTPRARDAEPAEPVEEAVAAADEPTAEGASPTRERRRRKRSRRSAEDRARPAADEAGAPESVDDGAPEAIDAPGSPDAVAGGDTDAEAAAGDAPRRTKRRRRSRGRRSAAAVNGEGTSPDDGGTDGPTDVGGSDDAGADGGEGAADESGGAEPGAAKTARRSRRGKRRGRRSAAGGAPDGGAPEGEGTSDTGGGEAANARNDDAGHGDAG